MTALRNAPLAPGEWSGSLKHRPGVVIHVQRKQGAQTAQIERRSLVSSRPVEPWVMTADKDWPRVIDARRIQRWGCQVTAQVCERAASRCEVERTDLEIMTESKATTAPPFPTSPDNRAPLEVLRYFPKAAGRGKQLPLSTLRRSRRRRCPRALLRTRRSLRYSGLVVAVCWIVPHLDDRPTPR